MITMVVGNNTERHETGIINEEVVTVRELLAQEGMPASGGKFILGDKSLTDEDMDKTLAELGVHQRQYLLNIAKTNNA